MATKKQIAAVAKQQAVVDKQIKELQKSIAAVNISSPFLSDIGFQNAAAQTTKVDPVAEAKAALDAAAKSGNSQQYQDALSNYRATTTTQTLGPKPPEKPGFMVQRVGNEWRYISTSTGGSGAGTGGVGGTGTGGAFRRAGAGLRYGVAQSGRRPGSSGRAHPQKILRRP